MSSPPEPTTANTLVNRLHQLALVTLGAFMFLILGTNSVAAAGGPLTWLAIWKLPAAGGASAAIGPLSLLPAISVVAWVAYRWLTPSSQRPIWRWGWSRITVPAAALWIWAIGRSSWQCLGGPCPRGAILRLVILGAVFFWAYLLIANEKPDLFYLIVAVIVLQSVVAAGQFLGQHDLGLGRLGELQLDPSVSGVSVVMRDADRWLRGYGLTAHPNALARTLVMGLLFLISWRNQPTQLRTTILWGAFIIWIAGMLVALSRWAWICLLMGLAIALLPDIRRIATEKPHTIPRLRSLAPAVVLLCLGLGFVLLYGDTMSGRIVGTDSPTESRSIHDRQRDLAIAVTVIAGAPLVGVGHGQYLDVAREQDAGALVVHNVPLINAAELGVVGLIFWLALLVGPLLRKGALSRYSAQTAAWFTLGCLGLFYLAPYPLADMTSAMLVAIAAGLMMSPSAELAVTNRFA